MNTLRTMFLSALAFHPSYITNGRFFVFYTRALPGDTQGNERHVLTTSAGWTDEGIAGYVMPLP